MENGCWIDLSHTLKDGAKAYPGDENLKVSSVATVERDGFTNFSMTTSMHFGTHIDSPLHFVEDAPLISSYSIDKFQGKACLIDCREVDMISVDLLPVNLREYEVALFYTGHDEKWGDEKFFKNHPLMQEDVAKALVEASIRIVGMDMPSPDISPFSVHAILLSSCCFIVENLCNLASLINKDNLHFFAFPLKIEADSSPVRAVVFCEE